jgi:Protein of unknown function (DUF962)
MPGLASYMERYDHEHTSAWNKLLHGVGIPLIFAGIVLLVLTKWILGASLFFGGWIFLLVGPIWVAREFWGFLSGRHPSPTPNAPESKRN